MKHQAAPGSPLSGFPVPAATLCCLLLPLLFFFLRHGYSSGDDLPFHLGSWADASLQLRHGVYPQWDTAAAYGAGEPRFVFYPPLSWLLGALLRMIATPAHAAEWFLCIAVASCWIGMYVAARRWFPASASLIAATVYAAAPYTLFNGLQRAAFGELLASALLPLLFAACIAPVPTVAAISVPLAWLWLTNIPTAILGSYLLLTVAVFRLLLLLRHGKPVRAVIRQAAVFAGGATLGLLLTSFFLLPALLQQRQVQLARAFSQGQGFRDNFLLHHTALTSRQTIHAITAIVLAYACVLLCVFAGTLLLRWRRKQGKNQSGTDQDRLLTLLAVLAVVLIFLLLPPSALVWQYLPKLAVLQFPWRVLSLLTLVLAYAVALLLRTVRIRIWHAIAVSALLAATLITAEAALYWRDPQQVEEHGLTRAAVAAKTQLRPTPEYTPALASNAGLRPMEAAQCDAAPDAVAEAQPAAPQVQWRFLLMQPALCTIPLRRYPQWIVSVNGKRTRSLHNGDGHITLPLPAGTSLVQVRWHSGPDRTVGIAATFVALLVLIALLLQPRFAREKA